MTQCDFLVIASTASAAEVERLKAELQKMKQEAEEKKTAAEQAAAVLSTLEAASSKHEARVEEVQQELKDAGTKCKVLRRRAKSKPLS